MRGIRVFAVVGLAVALVAVPALVQGQQTRGLFRIDVKCSTATPSKPEVDNRSVTIKKDTLVQWFFVADLNTCVKDLASAKITLNIPAEQSPLLDKPQGQPTSIFVINITAGQPATATYPVNRDATLGAGGISYTIEFFKQKDAKGDPIQGATIVVTPTLTEWGLIVLGLLLAGSLAFMIRRRLAPRPAGA
jgi:hypothetical protein